MGKTRLLRELSGEAGPGEARVLVGRAVEAGGSTAYRPFAEALMAALRHDPVPRRAEAAWAPFRRMLGRLVPHWGDGDGGVGESPIVLAEGILRLLRLLAGDGGLVLALEDLHWADPETLAIVEYLADNLAAEPVLLVWTARDEPGRIVALAEALAARGSGLLQLGPLDDVDVAAMSAACLEHEPSPELLAVLHHRAAGTPLLVEELLGTDGAKAASLVPASVRELVGRRIAKLSGRAQDCVRFAAVLGPVFDWTLLPLLVGVEPSEVVAALGEAADARLLDPTATGFRFPHALTCDAIRAGMLPPERAAAAIQALTTVRSAHPDLEPPWDEVAVDVALLAGDDLAAARVLLAAGRRDLSRGALVTAEATLGRAAELSAPDERLNAAVDEALAEVLALAGKTDAAAATTTRLINRLDQQVDASRIAAAHLRMARVCATAGDWSAAQQEVDQARGWANQAADLLVTARVDTAATQVALAQSRFEEARDRAAAALAAAERLGDTDTTCEALELLGRLARRNDLREAEALFERARVVAQRDERAVRVASALHELSTIDALDSLRSDRLEDARRRAMDVGALGTAAVIDLHLAAAAVMRWDLDRMRPFAERAVTGARRLRIATLPKALVLAGVTDIAHGRPDGGEPALAEALCLAPDDPYLTGEVWGARAFRSLLAADHERALDELERAISNGVGEVIASPYIGLWLLMTAAATGAVPPLPDGVSVSRWNRAYLRFAESIVFGRSGHAAEAAAAFDEADKTMRNPVDVRWHRRHARRITAEAALDDRWGDPADWITEDLPFFETLGHERIASACRGLLRRTGTPVPRRGPHAANVPEELRRLGVTAREHQVLQLVAEGLNNHGVAQRLVLSPRTVEKHVERLLAKTNLTKRTELVAYAVRATVSDRGR
jgi:DNA-binding CsgD family transcriptional regulator/tetratricopeptide (TPR) repeat protein